MEMTLRWYGSKFDTVTLKTNTTNTGRYGRYNNALRHRTG